MTAYRLYYLDEACCVRRAQDFECETDDHAIDHAAAVDYPHRLELWSGDRFVWRFTERIVVRDLISRRLSGPQNAQKSTANPAAANEHHSIRELLQTVLHHLTG